MYLILIYLKLLNNIIKPRVIPFTVPFVYMYCEEEIVIPDTCVIFAICCMSTCLYYFLQINTTENQTWCVCGGLKRSYNQELSWWIITLAAFVCLTEASTQVVLTEYFIHCYHSKKNAPLNDTFNSCLSSPLAEPEPERDGWWSRRSLQFQLLFKQECQGRERWDGRATHTEQALYVKLTRATLSGQRCTFRRVQSNT